MVPMTAALRSRDSAAPLRSDVDLMQSNMVARGKFLSARAREPCATPHAKHAITPPTASRQTAKAHTEATTGTARADADVVAQDSLRELAELDDRHRTRPDCGLDRLKIDPRSPETGVVPRVVERKRKDVNQRTKVPRRGGGVGVSWGVVQSVWKTACTCQLRIFFFFISICSKAFY